MGGLCDQCVLDDKEADEDQVDLNSLLPRQRSACMQAEVTHRLGMMSQSRTADGMVDVCGEERQRERGKGEPAGH